jgi:5-methylcytosine-specific restriction endonuclease McrA
MLDRLSQPVLILNTYYMPVSVRPVRDAICMVLLDKAQVLKASSEEFIRSEKLRVPIPHVILLSNYYALPKRVMRANRSNILERDGYTCVYCGKKPGASKLTLDHIIPRSRWAEIPSEKKPPEFHSWENMVTACRECNTRKGSKLLAELRWKIPESYRLKPKHNIFITVNKISAEKYGWNEYLTFGK